MGGKDRGREREGGGMGQLRKGKTEEKIRRSVQNDSRKIEGKNLRISSKKKWRERKIET
jgi:hypothetical protein